MPELPPHKIKEKRVAIMETNTRTFSPYRNKHYRETAVLMGTGPSLEHYVPKHSEGIKYLGVNGIHKYDKITMSYYFCQDWNSYGPNKEAVDNYTPTIAKFFGGDIGQDIENIQYHPLRHYKAARANPYYIILGENHEGKNDLDFQTDITGYLGHGGSCMFTALQFALFAGFKRIEIVGCDITNPDYFYGDANKDIPWEANKNHHLIGWLKMKKFIRKNYSDVMVVSVNPVGLKDLFPSVEYP